MPIISGRSCRYERISAIGIIRTDYQAIAGNRVRYFILSLFNGFHESDRLPGRYFKPYQAIKFKSQFFIGPKHLQQINYLTTARTSRNQPIIPILIIRQEKNKSPGTIVHRWHNISRKDIDLLFLEMTRERKFALAGLYYLSVRILGRFFAGGKNPKRLDIKFKLDTTKEK